MENHGGRNHKRAVTNETLHTKKKRSGEPVFGCPAEAGDHVVSSCVFESAVQPSSLGLLKPQPHTPMASSGAMRSPCLSHKQLALPELQGSIQFATQSRVGSSSQLRDEHNSKRREKYAAMPLDRKKKLLESRKQKRLLTIVKPTRAASTKKSQNSVASATVQGDVPLESIHSVLGHASSSQIDPTISSSKGNFWSQGSVVMQNQGLSRVNFLQDSPWMIPLVPGCIFCGAMRFYREPPGFCCRKGQVSVASSKMPRELWALYTEDNPTAREFRRRVRTYNNTSAFTSLGMKSDPNFTWSNRGVYSLKVSGIVYHFIEDLIPNQGPGSHLQLYFYGTENELENRLAQSTDLQSHILEFIMELMKLNPYANFFRSLRNLENIKEYNIMLRADPGLDARVYNLPTTDHVAAIWTEGVSSVGNQSRHIRVYTDAGRSFSVKYFYGCYDPLQYPLMFPYGEPGWHLGIEKLPLSISNRSSPGLSYCTGQQAVNVHLASSPENLLHNEEQVLQLNTKKRTDVSALEYYCYVLQIRGLSDPTILRCGRLSQQYNIDMYIKIETSRLDYLRLQQQQNDARMESYQGIVDSIELYSTTDGSNIGRRVVLPASFIGGPRDMRRRYMNAMALVQNFGKPDIFLTMTCNPAWPEIQCGLLPGEEAQNRSDLVARVFRARVEELKDELINKKIFGDVAAYIYVIEFQKRGLPHAHWLFIMKQDSKIYSPDAYDRIVSAELPDKSEYSYLHACVVKHMMHGPCGPSNPGNVCMRDGICKNHFPKDFCSLTSHRENSYPSYRRRDDGHEVMVRGCFLDNRWVVPYNRYLLAKFDCHINVEICSDIKLVKYLYKYVYKGVDRVAYHIVEDEGSRDIDEISNFQLARWICAPEAMWRIYGFSLNEMQPPVFTLQVHLPNQHFVRFDPSRNLANVISNPLASKTMLTEFFSMNCHDPNAGGLNLLYRDFPRYFVWNAQQKKWSLRKQRSVIGRLVTSNPSEGERYYLRLLLSHVRGPTSYEDLKTIDCNLYSTFREAALKRGLLESDNDIRMSLNEASLFQMPYSFRRLFATILVYNAPADPRSLWHEFQEQLSEDFGRDVWLQKEVVVEKTLKSIDLFLQSMGRSITEFSLVDRFIGISVQERLGREFEQETSLVISEQDLLSIEKLNVEQMKAYLAIVKSVESEEEQVFFVDGPGGTGKTFLYRALLASIRSKQHIALAVATSGVAASLLPGGRTAHSRFKLPIHLEETKQSAIAKQDVNARLIGAARLIIWDEASMAIVYLLRHWMRCFAT